MAAHDGMPPLVDASGAPANVQAWATPVQGHPAHFINGTPYVSAAIPVPTTPGQDPQWIAYPGNPPVSPHQWMPASPYVAPHQQQFLATPAQRTLPMNAPWLSPSLSEGSRVMPDEVWDSSSTLTSSKSGRRHSYYPQQVYGVSPHERLNYDTGPRPIFKRPEDWRKEFKMPNSGKTNIARTFMSIIKSDPPCHKTIFFNNDRQSCSWDMRRKPSHFRYISRNNEQRPHTSLELREAATDPPTGHIRLRHALLPWYIDINANTQPGENHHIITIGHLLTTLYLELQRQISHSDFYNEEVAEEDRRRINAAFLARVGDNQSEYVRGVRRVDFLGEEFVFEGIKKRGDEWVIKTGRFKGW